MLRSLRTFIGFEIFATDGPVGRIEDLYYDDEAWTVRYFVVQRERAVLVSPIAVDRISDEHRTVRVNLKRARIEESPHENVERPLNRGFERRYHAHFGWPVYWGAGGRWGGDLSPAALFTAEPFGPCDMESPGSRGRNAEDVAGGRGIEGASGSCRRGSTEAGTVGEDPHEVRLARAGELPGFAVHAQDGLLGRVEDLLLSDLTWEVRYLVLDSLASAEEGAARKYLLSPRWADSISAPERMIALGYPVATVRSSPPYDPARAITRNEEILLFRHYGDEEDIDAVRVGKREKV